MTQKKRGKEMNWPPTDNREWKSKMNQKEKDRLREYQACDFIQELPLRIKEYKNTKDATMKQFLLEELHGDFIEALTLASIPMIDIKKAATQIWRLGNNG